MLPLEYLQDSELAEITNVEGDPHFVARLADFGILVGSAIRMIQRGSPCLVQVGDARLSLRLNDHQTVFVRPIPAS